MRKPKTRLLGGLLASIRREYRAGIVSRQVLREYEALCLRPDGARSLGAPFRPRKSRAMQAAGSRR